MLRIDDTEIFLNQLENFLQDRFALDWNFTWKDSDEVLNIQLHIPHQSGLEPHYIEEEND